MANVLALYKKYTTKLDEIYKREGLTSVLESDSSLVEAGRNANEIVIPVLDMQGLGDYDRNSGYVDGDVTLTMETKQFNYDRGRMFSVDAMDNEETAFIAFGRLAGEFIRTKVIPEIDARRFARYASTPGATVVPAELVDGKEVLSAILAASTQMDEDEVPSANRHLFITPTKLNSVKALQTIESREALQGFASITPVPQSRFYSAVDLLDGKTSGQEEGSYVKSAAAKDLNFMIIHKPAVMQYTKHNPTKVITPEANQNADAWKFGYRLYGIDETYNNKVAGIFVHTKA